MSEDIVHDTFLRYADQQKRATDIRSVKDWLFVCAQNLIYNHLKKKSRTRYIPIQNVPSVAGVRLTKRPVFRRRRGRQEMTAGWKRP